MKYKKLIDTTSIYSRKQQYTISTAIVKSLYKNINKDTINFILEVE